MKRRLLSSLLVAMSGAFACAAANAAPVILVWGDSLSAGYGLDPGAGWVHLLERKLESQGAPYLVVNGSVSGETTTGGLARLPSALDRYKPELVLIELGGNDGLRGQPADLMRGNLEKMSDLAKAAGAKPVIFEMRIPSNYGPAFTDKFRQTFADVAKEKKAALVPFFLAPIATDVQRWFQPDGIHPNASAQPQLVDAVWPTLSPLLKKAGGPASRGAPAP